MKIGPLHILGLINLGLAGGLASYWVDQNGHPLKELIWVAPKPVTPEIVEPVVSLGDPNAGNLSMYASVVTRPVFAPDRRPPPPPKPPEPPPPPPPPDPFASVELMGMFTGPNGGVLARVEGRMRRVKINDNIGAWTLKDIAGREATFKQGDQERKLRLNFAKLDVSMPSSVASKVGAPTAPPRSFLPSAQALPQNQQDEVRERLIRRNALRAANGLPPLTE